MNEEQGSSGPNEPKSTVESLAEQKPSDGGQVLSNNPQTGEKNKNLSKTILIIILILILIVSAAGAAYLVRDSAANVSDKKQADEISNLEKEKADLKKQNTALKAAGTSTVTQTTQTQCTSTAPVASIIENIKSSITSGNTAALEGYMASSVNVILAASEGIGPSTPASAVSSISNFITSNNTSWDYNFSLPVATINSYQSGGYKQYFPDNAIVGKATNSKVISFSFDCDGKINTVFLATHELL